MLVLLGAGGYAAYQLTRESPAPEASPVANDPAPAPAAEAPSGTPRLIIGQVSAPITIIEYSDFQCPICKRFFETTEPQLLREWIDTGKAKLDFRVETHIGSGSVTASEAAYCANDQARFKDYHDAIFRRQGSADFNAALMKTIAAELKLDAAVFAECLDGGKYRAVVAESHREAQKVITGTPTFFIGDQKITGAQPYSIFKAILERQ